MASVDAPIDTNSDDHSASHADNDRTAARVTPVERSVYQLAGPHKKYALAITASLHAAALAAFLICKAPTNIASRSAPLVVNLLPLNDPRPEPGKPAPPQPRTKVKPVPLPPSPQAPEPALPAAAMPTSSVMIPNVTLPSVPTMALPPPVAAAPAPAMAPPADPGTRRGKDSWEGRVLARLERFKQFPASARSRRDQGVATLRFRVDRQGHILSSLIQRSSGNAALDQEALATLARAEPLPAIPRERPDEIELIVPVEFFLHRS